MTIYHDGPAALGPHHIAHCVVAGHHVSTAEATGETCARYETAVFSRDDRVDGEAWHWTAREAAEAGHVAVCAWLRGERERP